MSQLSPALLQKAEQWVSWDFNEQSKNEIKELITSVNEKELLTRLDSRIKFGTAGLRGKMQAGSAFMNHLTVAQASQGLVKTIQEVFDKEKPEGVEYAVCIGRDGRYSSEEFANIATSAFLSKGIPVYLFDGVVPTPLVVSN